MSTCTQRVIAVAKAKGLEYKVEGYNGKSDFSFIKDDKFIAEIQPSVLLSLLGPFVLISLLLQIRSDASY